MGQAPAILATIWYDQNFRIEGDEEPVTKSFVPRNRGATVTAALDECVVPPDERQIRHRLQQVN